MLLMMHIVGKHYACWGDLEALKVQNGAWVWMGDFNCPLNMEDRIGAPIRSSECVEFRRCVDNCHMEDMKATGCFYTWNNKQSGDARVFSNIDRVMCNVEWVMAYQFTETMFHPEGDFDHSPMVLLTHPRLHSGKKPFRYFAMWKKCYKL